MSLKTQTVKNVGATWLGLLTHAAVGVFLSPFILHRLGDAAFSLWVLVFALTGYFGLFDLGIRSSVVKYTARFFATEDMEQISRYVSTSLLFYIAISVVVLLMTAIGTFCLPLFFKIAPGLESQAKAVFVLAGASVALNFPLSVFAAVLEGLQKFSWLQLSNIVITLLRAALIFVALTNGGGLLTIATITVAMNIVTYLLFTWLAIRILPVRLSFRSADKSAFREMVTYGLFACSILAAEKLRFQSDAIVIGAFLSSTAITLFSIASKLVEYSSYAVRSMSQTVAPLSSHLDASGDRARLYRTLIGGNRASALIIFPVCLVLVIVGKSIIELWVGARYVSAYPVLVLLIVPRALYLAQSASTKILLGIGRHRVLAYVLFFEGAMNLLLSLLLVRPFGIVGVALGTAIPLACTSLVVLPRHLCRVLEVPLGKFLSQAYGLPLLLCVPLAVALWLVSLRFSAHSYRDLLLVLACGGVVYCGGLGLALIKSGFRRPISLQAFVQLLEPR